MPRLSGMDTVLPTAKVGSGDVFPAVSFEEFCAYIDFDAERDGALLRALWPHVEPRRDAIVDDFYRRIFDHAITRSVFESDEVVARLIKTLRVWLEELLNGPWDDAYVARRSRIGHVHVRVGVGHVTMFMAMSAMRQRLTECVDPLPEGVRGATVLAVERVTSLDLALMTERYHSLIRERRERDLRALLVTHMPAAVLLVDPEGRVQASTPASLDVVATREPEGKRLHEVFSAELLEKSNVQHFVERALATGHEVSLPRVDVEQGEERRLLSLTIIPIDEPDPGAIVHIEDHTLAVESERQLRRQEHLAQLGTMSATIAHELRNPLAGIGGALQVISRGLPADDRRAPIMKKIIEQVGSLNRLVTDLLAFARPDASRVQHGVDLADVGRTVVEAVAADHPEVAFEVRGSAILTSDPDLVHHVLMNLVLNACQALRGSGRIVVEAFDEGVRVSDDGPGLSPDVRARMFEPFYTTKLKGTGLGLPISLKIARVLDATLIYRDEGPLPGATFELRFGGM